MRKSRKGIFVLVIGGIIICLSIFKSVRIYTKDNVLEQVMHKEEDKKEHEKIGTDSQVESILDSENSQQRINAQKLEKEDTVENGIEQEISNENGGAKIFRQNETSSNDYYSYKINDIYLTKTLGDFENPYDILGHVDHEGNTEDGYSYCVVNMTIECIDPEVELFLNTIGLKLYQGSTMVGGHELLTTNKVIDENDKQGMKVDVKEGECVTYNLVFLIEDELIETTSKYLYINNRGASLGTDDENKFLINIEVKGAQNE